MVQPLWKIVWRFLKKLKTESPYGPAIPLLGIHPEKTKTLIQKKEKKRNSATCSNVDEPREYW